jgi:hypothetical protein
MRLLCVHWFELYEYLLVTLCPALRSANNHFLFGGANNRFLFILPPAISRSLRMLRGCHPRNIRKAFAQHLRECCSHPAQMSRGALHMRDIRVANAMYNVLDARITRVAPDVRIALHSMGYFWSVSAW